MSRKNKSGDPRKRSHSFKQYDDCVVMNMTPDCCKSVREKKFEEYHQLLSSICYKKYDIKDLVSFLFENGLIVSFNQQSYPQYINVSHVENNIRLKNDCEKLLKLNKIRKQHHFKVDLQERYGLPVDCRKSLLMYKYGK